MHSHPLTITSVPSSGPPEDAGAVKASSKAENEVPKSIPYAPVSSEESHTYSNSSEVEHKRRLTRKTNESRRAVQT